MEVLIVTDPGPDPDDVKALLVLAIAHKRGQLRLRGVVANGGHAAAARAALARCVLDHVGEPSIPVGIGSPGRPHPAGAHEYLISGFDRVDPGRLEEGAALILRELRAARPRSVTILLISSLRDFADIIGAYPALVLAKVAEVAVQGGLEADAHAPHGWRPDSSVNNEFDREAAAEVYNFCFEHALPLVVLSRLAVPMLPMQLARSFALRYQSHVMRYLADAQFLGLAALWQKLCAGELPARCTKQWYFDTFCGVGAAEFDDKDFAALGPDADIVPHLNGRVKPCAPRAGRVAGG